MAVPGRCSLITRAVKSHFTGHCTTTAVAEAIGSPVRHWFGDCLVKNSLFAGNLTRFGLCQQEIEWITS